MDDQKMKFILKTLNSVETQLITVGNPFDCNGSDVIVCITGNPGVPDFYTEFCSELGSATGFPICLIGHAGHIQVPHTESNILQGREHLYNLEGQLAHKLDLISNHIDKRSKLHIIGHSIGAWMALEILNSHEDITARVSSLHLLFPTIQRMADTINGKFLNGILRRIHVLIVLLFSLVFLLPEFIKTFLVNIYLKVSFLPGHYVERILKYINPVVGEKVLFLAYDEMDTVKALNVKAIEKVKHMTNVIFSSSDGWAPLSYMEDLKPFEPQLKMTQVNYSHAFVLKSSEKVAQMVANVINKER